MNQKTAHDRANLCQSIALALFLSINSIAAAINIENSVIIIFFFAYFFAFISGSFKIYKSLLAVIVVALYCLISAFMGKEGYNSYALDYMFYCIICGVFVFGNHFKIKLDTFLHIYLIISILTLPLLVIRSLNLYDKIGSFQSNSGAMMGMTYAICLGILLSFTVLVNKHRKLWKICAFAVLVGDLYIIMKIGSRGIFMVFTVFFLLIFMYYFFKRKTSKLIFLLFALLICVLIFNNLEEFIVNINDYLNNHNISIYALEKSETMLLADNFDNGRDEIIANAIKGIIERPFGHWVGSFEEKYGLYTHNIFLQMTWEFGLLGLVMAFVIFYKSAKRVFYGSPIPKNFFFECSIFCSSIVILFYSSTFWILICFWVALKMFVFGKPNKASLAEGYIEI